MASGFQWSVNALAGRLVTAVVEDPQNPGLAMSVEGVLSWVGPMRRTINVGARSYRLDEVDRIVLRNPEFGRCLDTNSDCTCPVGFASRPNPTCPRHGTVKRTVLG